MPRLSWDALRSVTKTDNTIAGVELPAGYTSSAAQTGWASVMMKSLRVGVMLTSLNPDALNCASHCSYSTALRTT